MKKNQYPKGSAKYRGKKKRRKMRFKKIMIILLFLIIIGAVIMGIVRALEHRGILADERQLPEIEDVEAIRPEMTVALLTPNTYSRPQTALENVNGIVIHYTANPGTTAMNNRDYFEGLKDSGNAYVSSHFVVGIEGEIVQCIPTNEIAYASNERNADTISIEVCHVDETGEFTNQTYDSLVALTGWLCLYLDVDVDNVIRHYDVTGNNCPKYYVEHEDAWEDFKEDVWQWVLSR